MNVVAGELWVILAGPRDGKPDPLSQTDFLASGNSMRDANVHLWDMEAVLLSPGSQL
jgi:hypothetical protein